MSDKNPHIDESASMDSDYGSSPRVGQENCAATQVNLGGWQAALNEILCVGQKYANKTITDHPATALLAAAAAGFAVAHLVRRSSK